MKRHDLANNLSENQMIIGLKASLCVAVTIFFLQGCELLPTTQKMKDEHRSAQTRIALAAEYIRTGDLDAAKRHLSKALEDNPRSSEAHTMMGVLLQREGSAINLRAAEAYFKKAIALDSDNAQARNNYGVYLTQLQRYPEALVQLEIAGATLGYEARANALENLGRIALLMGDKPRALRAFEQALTVDSSLLLARFEGADILYSQNKIAESAQAYDEYVQRLGGVQQGSRALWLGIRLAHAQQNTAQVDYLGQQLEARYPTSPEYASYSKAKQNAGLIWK